MKTRFAKNIKWQLLANILQAIFGGGFVFLASYHLGAVDFGVYSYVTAVVSVIIAFFDFRIQDILIRNISFLDRSHEETVKQTILEAMSFDLFVRTLTLLAVLIIGYWWNARENTVWCAFLISGMGLVVSKSQNGIFVALQRYLGRVDRIATSMLLDWGGKFFIVLLLHLFSVHNFILLLILIYLYSSVVNLNYVFNCISEVGISKSEFFKFKFKRVEDYYKNNSNLLNTSLGISLTDLMAKDFDVAVLGKVVSFDRLAVYKLSKTIVQSLWRGIDPVYMALMPEINDKIKNGEYMDLKLIISKIIKYMVVYSVVLVMVGYVGIKLIVMPQYGSEYSAMDDIYILMSVWVLISAPLIWGHPVAIGLNKNGISVFSGFLGSIVGMLLLSLLVTSYGIYAGSIAWCMTLVVTFSLQGYWCYIEINKMIVD